MSSGETPKNKDKRRLLKRKSTFLNTIGSPQAGPSVLGVSQFRQRNCSTPVSSTDKEENAWGSPQLASSPITSTSQDFYKQTGVAWQWESPKQSPMAKRRLTRRNIVMVQKGVSQEKRLLRSQTAQKEKLVTSEGTGGFLKFKEDLLGLDISPEVAPEADGSPNVEPNVSRVETTADMVKFVLEGSDTFCVTSEKPKDAPSDDRDFLFDDSAIDRDLEALAKEVEAKTATVPSQKDPPDKGFTQSDSEDFFYTVEDGKKSSGQDVAANGLSKAKTQNEDLKLLDDTSFDEILSQMPLDGSGTSRNISFGRHATMPVQKQTQPQKSISKGIFRYDSMPADPTVRVEPPSLSRNESNESVSSTSSAGKCSTKEIALKRLEAKQRLQRNLMNNRR